MFSFSETDLGRHSVPSRPQTKLRVAHKEAETAAHPGSCLWVFSPADAATVSALPWVLIEPNGVNVSISRRSTQNAHGAKSGPDRA
jgi:hypothetical protein